MKKLIFITLILFSVNSIAEDQVKYWQSFHSEMTPQDVADELNRMGLFKNKATVNKMPKKPKYTYEGYNWIPVITKSRIKLAGNGININGYILDGPFFEFDREDKLAEVNFRLDRIPGGHKTICLGCFDPAAADGEKAFTYLSGALQNKYKLISENINYGLESKSYRRFSDDETRVWLIMEKQYKTCKIQSEGKYAIAKVSLHYSDQQRINKLIIQAEKKRTKKEINTL